MVCLLRNFGNFPHPRLGFDTLPPSGDIRPSDDLARIKYCRNQLVHSENGRLSPTDFQNLWCVTNKAIERLDPSLKGECDSLASIGINSQHKELLGNLLNYIEEVKEQVNVIHLQDRRIKDLESKCHQMQTMLSCNQRGTEQRIDDLERGLNRNMRQYLLKDFQTKVVEMWIQNDVNFVKTMDTDIYTELVHNSISITLVGNPGIGKTSLMRHIALQLVNIGYDIVPIHSPSKLIQYFNPSSKQVFVIDDPLGIHQLNKQKLFEWREHDTLIIQKLLKSKSKILSTVRLSIYNNSMFASLQSLNLSVLKLNVVLADRQNIFRCYFGKSHSCFDLTNEVLSYHDCFPLLCYIYSSSKDKGNAQDFFRYPFEVFKEQLESLWKTSKEAYNLLLLLTLHDGCLSKHTFMDFHEKTENNKMSLSILEILGESKLSKLGRLDRTVAYKGVFFDENEDSLVFVHCMVKDVICKLLVLKHPYLFLKYSSSNFIRERIRLSKFLHSKDISKAHLIILSEEFTTSYLKRMLKEIVRGSAEKVFCHSQTKSPSFEDEVIEHLSRLSNEKIEKIVFSYCKQESTEHNFIFVEKSRNDNEAVPETIVLPTTMNGFETCTIDFIVVAGLNDLLLFVESKFKKRVSEHILKNTNAYRELAIISGNVETYKLITEIDTTNTTTSRHVVHDLGKAVFLGRHSTIQFLLHHSPICKESMKYAGICGHLAEINLRLRKSYPHYMRFYFKIKRLYNRYIGVGNPNYRRLQQQILYESKHLEIQSIRDEIQRDIAISKFQSDYWQSMEENLAKNGETKVPTLLSELLKINEDGISFLEVASMKGYDSVVRSILDNMLSCPSDIQDNLERTLYNALRKATFFGNADVLQTLLDYGAVVHLVYDAKDTPLMIAASKGYILISEILIQNHADINHKNIDGNTTVHFAARNGHCDMIDLLCRNGAIMNVVCEEGQTPLFVAASNGHLKALKYLLTVESFVDFPDNYETTPLLAAVKNGHSECVELLLRFGADPRFIFPDCYKCCFSKSFKSSNSCIIEILFNYLQFRHMETTSSILDRERNPNLDIFHIMVNSIVQTHDKHLHESACFILAAKHGRTDVIQHMLQEGCNIDQQDEAGYTAICAAASTGQIQTIEFLIKHSANLNIASTSGMTPLLSSLRNSHFDAAQLLSQSTADANTSVFNENSLLLSIQWGEIELAKRIRTGGARMNVRSTLLAMESTAFITLFTKMEMLALIFFVCGLVAFYVFRHYYIDIYNVCLYLLSILVIYDWQANRSR